MSGGHGLAYRLNYLLVLQRPVTVAVWAMVHLRHDDQLFLAVDVDRERAATTRTDRWMAVFDCQLDVLRMIVPAGDDDQIADSARDVKLSVEQETEIARAQEWTFAGVRKASAKLCFGLFRLVPVAERDTRPAHPDLADSV